jgi:hypothetical protein
MAMGMVMATAKQLNVVGVKVEDRRRLRRPRAWRRLCSRLCPSLLAACLGCGPDPVRVDLIAFDTAMKPVVVVEGQVNGAIDRMNQAVRAQDTPTALRALREEIIPGHGRMFAIIAALRPATPELELIWEKFVAAEQRQLSGFRRYANALARHDPEDGRSADREISVARELGTRAKADILVLGGQHGLTR